MEAEASNSNKWMKTFFPIWGAQIFSLLGSGLVQFALVWYLTQKTGSAAILAMATFVALLPNVLLAPFAGALIDRWNRRLVMIIADGSIALVTLVLVILFATNLVQVWHIFVVLFLRAFGSMFHWPAMQASTSLMVPEKHLSRVAGINQAISGGLNIAAPPLGALLMSLISFYQVVAIDIVTAIIAITPLFFIKIPQPVRTDQGEKVSVRLVLKDIGEGFRFLKAWPGILLLTVLAAALNFFLAPVDTFLPLLVTQYFKQGVWELGVLQSAVGVGVVAGGLLLGVWGGFKSKVVTSLVGVIGIGLGVMLLAATPVSLFALAVVAMVFMGISNPIANGPLMAIMQSKVPPEMQGRVMGFSGSLCSAMMPIAMLVSAPVVDQLGLHAWYWAAGLITAVMGVVMFFLKPIMQLDSGTVVPKAEVVTN
jgi:DHA3 family macrolide efflux protein-like MFS transporter